MKQKDCDILIIGAGITGLSLASFLETDNYLIVDKDSEVGGYCKTTIRNGFVWDYSGHFFISIINKSKIMCWKTLNVILRQ